MLFIQHLVCEQLSPDLLGCECSSQDPSSRHPTGQVGADGYKRFTLLVVRHEESQVIERLGSQKAKLCRSSATWTRNTREQSANKTEGLEVVAQVRHIEGRGRQTNKAGNETKTGNE